MARWSEEDMERAAHLFRTTALSLKAIAMDTGVPISTVHLRARKNGWARAPGLAPPTSPQLVKATHVHKVNAAGRRRDLALRALAAAERQMEDIEARLARGAQDVVAEERSARVLAATIRTLRELAALDSRAAESARALGLPERDGTDAPAARSLDEIREDFANRLAELFGGEDEPGEPAGSAGSPEPLGPPGRRTLPPRLDDWPGDLVEWLGRDWLVAARDDQLPPERPDDWTIWLVLGGRGAGKTRTGAEWVRGQALGLPWYAAEPVGRIAIVGETFAAARDVMIEGDSGLLKVHDGADKPLWSSSLKRLVWPNGAVAHVFSSEDPDSLRGPQFGAAWADELAKWRHVEETWDMLQFGLRLGRRPREIVTTTPRPIPLVKRLVADPQVALSHAATAANARHLAPSFLERIVGRYAGTRLGRQELDGEIISERPDALWTRETIERSRASAAPELARIVVAVDPPASSGARADACGLVVAGIDAGGTVFVLADATASGLAPPDWAARAAALYRRWEADALVVEVNQGGEMVSAVLAQADPGVPVTPVHATRGKFLRAEPVSMLYAKGRVRHVGAFPELEDEMCDFGPGGLSSNRSPDRLDALVWALTHLALGRRAEPRIRML